MVELSIQNAPQYLAAHGFPWPRSVTELGGGVSNTVLLAESSEGRYVLKQSLAKLRVATEWLCDPDRVFRESAVLRMLAPHLPAGCAPQVLFEDCGNRAFVMTAAPASAQTWKAQLLAGNVLPETAARVGELLAAIWRLSWRDQKSESLFGDQAVFDQLRLDPYYRFTARRYPRLAPHFDRLMRDSAARRLCLVHGDWSPKNFLVDRGVVMAIDFEVIHFGDPAFDAAFLLNHLALKSFHRPSSKLAYREAAMRFWNVVIDALPERAGWFPEAVVAHLGALMLARVDGKSPVEYLADEPSRNCVRAFACRLIENPPSTIDGIFDRL